MRKIKIESDQAALAILYSGGAPEGHYDAASSYVVRKVHAEPIEWRREHAINFLRGSKYKEALDILTPSTVPMVFGFNPRTAKLKLLVAG